MNLMYGVQVDVLSYITWDVSPVIVSFGEHFVLRWYGLLFASAFFIGHLIMRRVFLTEAKPLEALDSLTIYVVIGVIVGARLGHCIFYDPYYYFVEHPEEIVQVWKGGLASHGGAIGIILALLLFIYRNQEFTFLWVADRLALVIPLGAAFVRLGNLFNSEICGVPTNLPWAFRYPLRDGICGGVPCNDCGEFPRHPTQLYEAGAYILLFLLVMFLYRRWRANVRSGKLIGILLLGLFIARLFIEFVKENQESYQTGLPLNTGQLLSIPFIILGIYLSFFKKS
ncbi:MAG: prolipoprotein diacylglyceryl transferase [Bacteroidia bacterium]|nr:prolipoprotein diacylglyceryl transferase [Bacteroidia bacterium]